MELPTPPDLTEETNAEKDPNRKGMLKVIWYTAILGLTLAGIFIAAFLELSKKSGEDCQDEVVQLRQDNGDLKNTLAAKDAKEDGMQDHIDLLNDKVAYKDSLLYVAGTASLQSISTKNAKAKKIIKSTK